MAGGRTCCAFQHLQGAYNSAMKISKNAVLFLRITLNFLDLPESFLGNTVFNLKAAYKEKKKNKW